VDVIGGDAGRQERQVDHVAQGNVRLDTACDGRPEGWGLGDQVGQEIKPCHPVVGGQDQLLLAEGAVESRGGDNAGAGVAKGECAVQVLHTGGDEPPWPSGKAGSSTA